MRNMEGNEVQGRRGTTHRHIAPITSLNRKLQSYILEAPGFELHSPERREYFTLWTIQALARLDSWQQTGHNFLKSRQRDDIEPDFAILFENISAAQAKLGISFEEMRQHPRYHSALEKLLKDYSSAEQSFQDMRSRLAKKQGIMSGAIYGASSMILQWLSSTGVFSQTKTITTPDVVTPGGLETDRAIATQLQSVLGDQKYNDFIQNLSHATNPNTLWETLTRDIFQNPSVGNDAKNQIMTFILNATDIQNGIVKPELLIEAGKQGLFTDIANNSSSIDRMFSLLGRWGYENIDRTWFIETLR